MKRVMETGWRWCRRVGRSAPVAVAVVVCLVSMEVQAAERRVALVIGNGDYAESPLKNPLNDAHDMRERLVELGFNRSNIVYYQNLKTSQIGDMLRKWKALLNAGGDTEALVYYAGHGVQVRGENYLTTVDARIAGVEDVPRQSVKVSELMAILTEAQTRLNLVFLDACRNNPYPSLNKDRNGVRGLAKEPPPSGTLIAFATKPGAVADDGSGRNGVFTGELLKHMATPGIPVEQMLKRVIRGVRDRTGGSQYPWPEGSIDGDFYFVPGAPPPPPEPPRPVTPQPGQTVKDCADCPELVVIPSGSFQMGSETGDSDEKPVHPVTIPRALAVGRTEVTVAQYLRCVAERGCDEPQWREKGSTYHYQTGSDQHYRQLGAALTGDNHPVVGVSWNNAQQYVKWLSAKTSGKGYRLLSEAEWEYAARAGSTATYSFGDSESALGDYAWFSGNSGGKTQPVAQKKPNAFGLYDMHGNAWEWVEDVWHDNYTGAPTDGSVWKVGGDSARRVLRGGSWGSGPWYLRSAERYRFAPGSRDSGTGFRIARTFSL